MCGMWRILPVSCWEPLVWRFFSGCWKAWSFPALAEKDQIFFFFFDHSWENFAFLKEDRSAGWEAKHPACDLSLLIRARPADMACASPLGQWDKAQLKREAGYCGHWLLILFLSLSHVLRQPKGHHLRAVSLWPFPGSAAGHQTYHQFISHLQPKKLCNNFSSLITCPGFEPRGERLFVSSCYIPEPCHGAQSLALDFHF